MVKPLARTYSHYSLSALELLGQRVRARHMCAMVVSRVSYKYTWRARLPAGSAETHRGVAMGMYGIIRTTCEIAPVHLHIENRYRYS